MKIDGVLKEAVCAVLRMLGQLRVSRKGYEWERVAGTSAGAIIAALLVRIFLFRAKTIITDIDYNKFTKKTFIDKIPLSEKD